MDKRLRWFDDGASKLRPVLERLGRAGELPAEGSFYACPCCLGVYGREAVAQKALTQEDVPPKAVGGRPLLLTCARCNHGSGSTLDAQAARRAVSDSFARGDAGSNSVSATCVIDGFSLRGTAQMQGGNLLFHGIPKQNAPVEQVRFEQALAAYAPSAEARPALSLTVHTTYDDKRARLSSIRAAYLAGFAALGWSYILRPAMQPIRDQLDQPDGASIETFVFRDPLAADSQRRILLVNDPPELDCVAVMIGEYSVFLPGVWQPRDWASVAAAFRSRCAGDDRLDVRLHGKEVPWPRWPMYLLD